MQTQTLFRSVPTWRGLAAGALLVSAHLAVLPVVASAQSIEGFDVSAAAQERSGDVQSPLRASQFRAAGAELLGVDASNAQLILDRIEGPVVLPETGRTLWIASVLLGDERKVTVALDALGQSVDLEAAKIAERVVAFQRRGKFTAALAERIDLAPGATVRVAAWIDVEDVDAARLEHAAAIEALDEAGQLTEADVDYHLAEIARKVAATIEPETARFAEDLRGLGIVAGADTQAPLVFFETDLARLQQIADDPRVLVLDAADTDFAPRLENAFEEVRADKVYSNYSWANADYSRVGIVEGGRPCAGSFLDIVEFRQSGSNSSHTTGVASCVASSHPTETGVAKGARLYAANGATFSSNQTFTSGFQGSVDAITWAISRGCHIMNLSYGAGAPGSNVTGFDKYLDYVARYNARTLAIACGNSGAYAGDPGAGFNQIAVGNFTDQNDYNWTSESMASSSSWQNPTTGVETPQVAAPGTGLTMLDCSNGTSYSASGTSFSSPIVAGIAALIVDRVPSLGSWPEPVRAIVMATAWHNIEGSSRLSSKDGAGGVSAYAAFRVAGRGKGNGYQYGTLYPSSFDSSGLYTTNTVWVSAGTKVRACLSFDSQVKKSSILSFTWYDSTLDSDLDFRCYSPSGALKSSSSSSVQPFEMLEFTATESGYHTFKVRNWSFGGSSEYFGTAVSLSYESGE
ncbi:S8 family peptidase [Engelhardtia mirabilis]|uniref:Serine protease AprX n=1 Tax=Engelhardtia mirabilis TaxID=2528011 RepID=A0A518BHL4_9BACT|nr:Serine protease AprX [Planctomycetes bacterium Pla133]QDV00794.1 Serine protease AprX [Planctomycetes bacterium Pla86]